VALYTKESERSKRREGSGVKAISRGSSLRVAIPLGVGMATHRLLRFLSFLIVRFLDSHKVFSQEQEN